MVGEEAQLAALAVLVQDINRVLPAIQLGGVKFAKVQNRTLDDASATDALAFAVGVAGMRLGVFDAGPVF